MANLTQRQMRTTPKSVLVVDDHEAVLESIAMFVMHIGHAALTVSSGAEALNKLDEGKFDLVLTDLQMPGMRGDELAREIKKRRPDLPVVLMTAGRAHEHCSPSFAGSLPKPFSLAELRNVIADLCGSEEQLDT